MGDTTPPLLTNKNFLIYAIKNYQNPHCTGLAEFKEDLQRLKHIKKLITRYVKTGELRHRLILNHLIVLNNCFGPEATCRIIFLKMKPHLCYIAPFLILLNIMPETVW